MITIPAKSYKIKSIRFIHYNLRFLKIHKCNRFLVINVISTKLWSQWFLFTAIVAKYWKYQKKSKSPVNRKFGAHRKSATMFHMVKVLQILRPDDGKWSYTSPVPWPEVRRRHKSSQRSRSPEWLNPEHPETPSRSLSLSGRLKWPQQNNSHRQPHKHLKYDNTSSSCRL